MYYYHDNGNLISSSHESRATSREYNWANKLRYGDMAYRIIQSDNQKEMVDKELKLKKKGQFKIRKAENL